MQATPKQRISSYLLALLFVWANGFAAPYQSIQSVSSEHNVTIVPTNVEADASSEINALTSALQLPINDGDHIIYCTYPAEETFEEEDLHKDCGGLLYVFLPEFLILPQLSAIEYPSSSLQHDDYRAELNQSTYLFDCTFLI